MPNQFGLHTELTSNVTVFTSIYGCGCVDHNLYFALCIITVSMNRSGICLIIMLWIKYEPWNSLCECFFKCCKKYFNSNDTHNALDTYATYTKTLSQTLQVSQKIYLCLTFLFPYLSYFPEHHLFTLPISFNLLLFLQRNTHCKRKM